MADRGDSTGRSSRELEIQCLRGFHGGSLGLGKNPCMGDRKGITWGRRWKREHSEK